ncbi:hypothetical protein TNCV_3265441 [Trichonephila clavipes]|nr:hypothetical protein TNCV_3265441 [Trichonephila clavipes]
MFCGYFSLSMFLFSASSGNTELFYSAAQRVVSSRSPCCRLFGPTGFLSPPALLVPFSLSLSPKSCCIVHFLCACSLCSKAACPAWNLVDERGPAMNCDPWRGY